MLVYGALATHGQTAPERLTIPLFARSMIYEAKTVRGFWLFRWFTTTPPKHVRQALEEVRDLVADRILDIPEGRQG
jgi:NADPH2:quinone reductase